jgi:membrane protein YqaA with SNARE-associated domain
MGHHLYLVLAVSMWRQLHRWGGWGLIVLGIADNSIIPLTGSMDVLTIWLAARHREPWPYYAAMATIGALGGGYITYSLARKGGKEALERKVSKKNAKKVSARVERWGFGLVAVSAVLPPPFPLVPVLVAAGALQYSRKKFVVALALGRGVRYSVVAWLGDVYGRHIVSFFSQYYEPTLAILIALAVVGGVISLIQYLRYRKQSATKTKVVRRQAA